MSFEDRYSRSKFFNKNIINGVNECELSFSKFGDFVWPNKFKNYKIIDGDLKRPDMISLRNYGRINYWWIIMKVNGILDIQNDLYVGMNLKIPNEVDIQNLISFLKK